jgi:hypothetical protein
MPGQPGDAFILQFFALSVGRAMIWENTPMLGCQPVGGLETGRERLDSQP